MYSQRRHWIERLSPCDSIVLVVLVLMSGGFQDNARDAGAQSLTFILLEEAKATSVSQCAVGSEETKFQP